MKNTLTMLTLALAIMLPALAPAYAANTVPPELQGVGITPKPGAHLPLDATFRDENGKAVHLGDYFHSGRPVILNLMFFRCTMLCIPALHSMIQTLNELPPSWSVGREFDVVTVSFDPTDDPASAYAQKKSILALYDRTGAAAGWHVLTGDEKNIHALTNAVGFYYRWNPKTNMFAHDVAQIVVSPAGIATHYLRSVTYDPQAVRLALTESAGGKFGSVSDRFLLYACCSFDPSTSQFVISPFKLMRFTGLGVLVLLGGFIGALVLVNRRRRSRQSQPAQSLVHSP